MNVQDEGAAGGKDDSFGLNDQQKAAISTLVNKKVYVGQSKWRTLKELPMDQKWSFFVQHFLLAIVAALVCILVIVGFSISVLTKPPTPVLSVQGFGMSPYANQLGKLKQGFVKAAALKDQRLIRLDGSFTVNTDSYDDNSTKILSMVSAGQINMMISSNKVFPTLYKCGYISKPADALGKKLTARFLTRGALVDAHGQTVTDPSEARGLDLSKSKTWTRIHGLPYRHIIGLSNVQSSLQTAKQFLDYLDFGTRSGDQPKVL